jgi:hypothetical protein
MYQFNANLSGVINSVVRLDDVAHIPLNPDNRDYVQFLEDWKNGAEVLNPDGTPAPYVAPETP